MIASQSGVFSLQEFTDVGAPLVAGRLYTYTQGTTTHKTAYTDKDGSIAHTYTSDGVGGQYIGLNARGELPAPLYLASGSYDITLKDSTGATIWTRRADPVDDSAAALRSDLASTSDASKGAGMVGYNKSQPYDGGTVGSKLREKISVSEYAELVFTATAKSPGDAASHTATSFTSWRLAIQAAIDEAYARGGCTVVVDGGMPPFAHPTLLVDDSFTVKAGVRVVFEAEVKLADYTTTGQVLYTIGDDIEIINPMIDGSGLYAGGSGQNGIGLGDGNGVKVFGGRIRNCARGNTGPMDGGKAVQAEATLSNVLVDGTVVEDCFMALSAHHDFVAETTCGPLIFTNIEANDCGILLFVRQTSGRDTTGQEHSVVLSNFSARNCGTFEGAIQLSRASSVLVANGKVVNSTSIHSLIRGNHAFSRFENIDFSGDCSQIISLDPSTYAVDSSYVNENNVYDIKHIGTAGYVAYASLATANRVLQDSKITAHLKNDVTTKIVGDELRNGYCLLEVQQGARSIVASTDSLYLESRTNFASFPTGLSAPRQNVTQLSFPSPQIASTNPNTLDDYCENDAASPIVLTDSSGAGLSFTVQYADYTKIGRMVFVSFRVTYPVTASGASSSISGLPVAAANNSSRVCCGLSLRYTDIGSGVTGVINPGGVAFGFSSLSGTALTNAALSGKTVDGLITYMAAT